MRVKPSLDGMQSSAEGLYAGDGNIKLEDNSRDDGKVRRGCSSNSTRGELQYRKRSIQISYNFVRDITKLLYGVNIIFLSSNKREKNVRSFYAN